MWGGGGGVGGVWKKTDPKGISSVLDACSRAPPVTVRVKAAKRERQKTYKKTGKKKPKTPQKSRGKKKRPNERVRWGGKKERGLIEGKKMRTGSGNRKKKPP